MTEVLKHLIKQINISKINTNPFEHIFVENIFPSNFYSDLINNLPELSEYTPIKETGTVGENYSAERYIINFDQSTRFAGKRFQQVYNILIEALTSKDIFNSITNKFIKTINDRIIKFSNKERMKFGSSNFDFDLRAALVKDQTMYSLGAHTDSIAKYMTFLFYLPKNNSMEYIGTSLFAPKKDYKSNDFHSQHYSDKETKKFFDEVKICPFRPNSVLIFPRQNMSFHGVNRVNIEKKERDILLLNYYFKKIK